ncbi:hypothetical protein [Jeotgalibacillus proteolyticus]|uniref:Uncharacterized protein n=1 Tax=Jeotgalibacillus proteolyticus TaxID=2082395 RepID=A0A2S5G620_9BACL|nr:hypothetical protein [Jeotgalibacillus proteolyticus]PPA68428.1 hypothetical protein C4B60_20910 [Jeotgalibacillus proteolyticus]
MNESKRLYPTDNKKNNRPSSQKQKDYPTKTNGESSGKSNQNNSSVNDFTKPEQRDLATGAQNLSTFKQDSGNYNLSNPLLQEKQNRHFGQVVSDNIRSKASVKSAKRTYEIARNTGESLKKNIADYREKYRRGNG